MNDDHHDNRYEDGDESTGTVEDYVGRWGDGRPILPAWIRIVYAGHKPGTDSYAVECDTDFGPTVYFRGTLRECAAEAVRIENWEPDA